MILRVVCAKVARAHRHPITDIGERLVGFYSKLTTEDVRYVGTVEVAEPPRWSRTCNAT